MSMTSFARLKNFISILHFCICCYHCASGNLQCAFGFRINHCIIGLKSCLPKGKTTEYNFNFKNHYIMKQFPNIVEHRVRKMKYQMHLANEKDGEDFITSKYQINNVQPSFILKKRNPYDVHVYYNSEDERKEAMVLREKMQKEFPWMRFYNPKGRSIGPHPVPMWEADFGDYENRDLWINVREFIDENHGNLSILIHPHSLDGDYADHTKNAYWAGEVIDLKIQGWK